MNDVRIVTVRERDCVPIQLCNEDIAYIENELKIQLPSITPFTIFKKQGILHIQLTQFVGIFPLKYSILRILPKCGVDNFIELMTYCSKISLLNDQFLYSLLCDDTPTPLVAKIIESLISEVEQISTGFGWTKRFTSEAQISSFASGRVDFLKSDIHFGYCGKFFHEKVVQTFDTFENRIVHTALQILMQVASSICNSYQLQHINYLLQLFKEVPCLDEIEFDTVQVVLTKQNCHYETMLHICQFIIQRLSISVEHSAIKLWHTAQVTNMDTLFEDTARKLIQEFFSEFIVEKPNLQFFDSTKFRKIQPDIAIRTFDQTLLSILDAKYKQVVSNHDLYQMLSYLFVCNCATGCIIQFQIGNTQKTLIRPLNTEKEIYIISVDSSSLSSMKKTLFMALQSISLF